MLYPPTFSRLVYLFAIAISISIRVHAPFTCTVVSSEIQDITTRKNKDMTSLPPPDSKAP